MRILKYVPVILLLSACTPASLHPVNNSKWEGTNIKQLENKWGMANQIVHNPDGTSSYIYTTITYQNLYPSPMTTYATMVGPGQIKYGMPVTMQVNAGINQQTQLYCTTVLETDKNGIITSEKHEGNNCVNPALLKSISNS